MYNENTKQQMEEIKKVINSIKLLENKESISVEEQNELLKLKEQYAQKQKIMIRKNQMTKLQINRQFNEKTKRMRKDLEIKKSELLKPYIEENNDCTRRIRNLENIFLNGTGDEEYKKKIEARIEEIEKEKNNIEKQAETIIKQEEEKVNSQIKGMQERIDEKMEQVRMELNDIGIQVEKFEVKEIDKEIEKNKQQNDEKNKNQEYKDKKTEEDEIIEDETIEDETIDKNKSEDDNKSKNEKNNELKDKDKKQNIDAMMNNKPKNKINTKKKMNIFKKIGKAVILPIKWILNGTKNLAKAINKAQENLLYSGEYEPKQLEQLLEELNDTDEIFLQTEKQAREEQRRENLHMDKEEQAINHKEAIEKVEEVVLTEEVEKTEQGQEK